MSLQEYTPWFNNPATNPIPKPFSRTGPHQTDAVFPEVDDSPYGAHVAPVHPYDKEPMFENPLTPSDVGKLNRLVIPKMQAEKYFPLGGGAAAGTLLGFEDEDGKEWRFRYSYWNSSQSYVLTKGWSRYVKEKRLETGNVVFFERHRADPERMFIGWRRPGSAPEPAGNVCYNSHWFMPYQYDSVHAPAAAEEQETTGGSSNSRRQVRLFGVNLEYQLDNSPSSQTTSSGSSYFSTQQQSYQFYFDHNPHHM